MSNSIPNVPPSHEFRTWAAGITPDPKGNLAIAISGTLLDLRTGVHKEYPPIVVHPKVAEDAAMQLLALCAKVRELEQGHGGTQ